MTDQLVSLDTARLAKEKGFNALNPNNSPVYTENGSFDESGHGYVDSILYPAPTQSPLQKWLREVHGWHIITIPTVTGNYTFKIIRVWKKDFDPDLEVETPPYSGVDAYDYKDHEEALEQGLQEALKLI